MTKRNKLYKGKNTGWPGNVEVATKPGTSIQTPPRGDVGNSEMRLSLKNVDNPKLNNQFYAKASKKRTIIKISYW
jgi:hypothetical protein